MIVDERLLYTTKESLREFEKDELVELMFYVRYKLNKMIEDIFNTTLKVTSKADLRELDKDHLITLLIVMKNELKKI